MSFVLILRYVKKFPTCGVIKIHYPVWVAFLAVCAGSVAFDALDIFSDFKTFFVPLHRSVFAIMAVVLTYLPQVGHFLSAAGSALAFAAGAAPAPLNFGRPKPTIEI